MVADRLHSRCSVLGALARPGEVPTEKGGGSLKAPPPPSKFPRSPGSLWPKPDVSVSDGNDLPVEFGGHEGSVRGGVFCEEDLIALDPRGLENLARR